MTPVTATYNQIGKVIFAIFLCLSKSFVIARTYETKTKGITVIDNNIWEIKMK